MSIITPDHIIQLWPSLSEEVGEKLVEIAESIAEVDSPLELSPEEELLLEQAREDFKYGRTLSLDDYKADLDAFLSSGFAPNPIVHDPKRSSLANGRNLFKTMLAEGAERFGVDVADEKRRITPPPAFRRH